jgi:hypothetical protein
LKKVLAPDDQIIIGESRLVFQKSAQPKPPEVTKPLDRTSANALDYSAGATEVPTGVKYDDQPLGHTQMQISAREIIGHRSNLSIEAEITTPEEVKELRRKAKALDLLYEMSKTLGTVFDLKEIFVKATDLIFRGTPAERVVALLADETVDGKILDYSLYPIAARARDAKLENLTDKLTISRTITQKVMREKVALLSQDAKTDEQFGGAESIVAQGVRSTICAPLITESNVHGVIYADRFDPFAAFSPDDLELISAVAAQAAMVVETVKAHKRLAREEIARANYDRFMPEYVVKQILNNPDSFKLGRRQSNGDDFVCRHSRIYGAFGAGKSEKVVGLLNRYFSADVRDNFRARRNARQIYRRRLDGDFRRAEPRRPKTRKRFKTASTMQRRLATLNEQLGIRRFLRISVGIGLHTGRGDGRLYRFRAAFGIHGDWRHG